MTWCGINLPPRTILSYFYDLILLGITFIVYFVLEYVNPFERPIERNDLSIQFPHTKHELVPSWSLPLVSFGIPLVIILSWMGIQRFNNKRLFIAFLGLFLALTVTIQTTVIVKLLVGRLRPDFLARCDPDPAILDRVVCRGAATLIREGRKSFPSGHSSSSFAGLGYAGFFLAGQLGVFDGTGRVYTIMVALLPFAAATYVGISRIMDYRHHWQDVVVGSIIGIVFAYISYRMYFPSLMDTNAAIPYDNRLTELARKENDATAPSIDSRGLDAV